MKKSKLERELIQLDKDLAPRKERLAKQASDYEGKVGKAKVRADVSDVNPCLSASHLLCHTHKHKPTPHSPSS